MKKYVLSVKRKAIIPLSLLFIFSLTQFAISNEEVKITFDPSKIEMDDSWEEQFIGKGSVAKWCGENHLIYGNGKLYLLDIRNNGVKEFPWERGYWHIMGSCTPDGLYVFLKRDPIRRIIKDGVSTLEIYSTKTLEKIKTVPIPETFLYFPHISPNGRQLRWFTDGEIILDKDHKVKLVPVSIKSNTNFFKNVWSKDHKKIYLFHFQGANHTPFLLEYDIADKKGKSVRIDTGNPVENLDVNFLKLHPDGKRLFFIGRINHAESGEFFGRNLYEIDLTDLDWSKPSVTAKLFMKSVSKFNFSREGDLAFTVYRVRLRSSSSGVKHGIYLLEKGATKIKKLTQDHSDEYPRFSKDGKAVSFVRVPEFEGEATPHNIHILKKK